MVECSSFENYYLRATMIQNAIRSKFTVSGVSFFLSLHECVSPFNVIVGVFFLLHRWFLSIVSVRTCACPLAHKHEHDTTK